MTGMMTAVQVVMRAHIRLARHTANLAEQVSRQQIWLGALSGYIGADFALQIGKSLLLPNWIILTAMLECVALTLAYLFMQAILLRRELRKAVASFDELEGGDVDDIRGSH